MIVPLISKYHHITLPDIITAVSESRFALVSMKMMVIGSAMESHYIYTGRIKMRNFAGAHGSLN